MTEREFQAYKEKAIAKDVAGCENRIRHAFNQGVECGRKLQTQPQEGDRAVSLNAVIDAIEFFQINPQHFDFVNLIDDIKELPSVSQTKKGHWIEEDMFDGDVAYRCSECNELFCIIEGTPKDNEYNFCPNCGARMKGGTSDA